MPDIAMCWGGECPHKDKCHRFIAKADEYQAYFLTPPVDEEGKCNYYWGKQAESIWKQLNDIVKPK
jgi:hypothetical protein